MIIGISILFVIVYNNQRKIRGLKYKVIIKDGIFDYIDQTNTEELQTKPVEMMKSITANAVKPHFSLIIWMFIILLLFPMGWIFIVGMPYGALFVGSIGYFILIFPFLLLRKKAQKSFIEYDMDEKSKERYEEIVKSFEIIEKAENFGCLKLTNPFY